MGCRPKTLLFALIEKADATRHAAPTSKRMFSYVRSHRGKRNNKQHLAPVSNGMAVCRREDIYICVYVVRDARNFLAFGYSSIALPASSYLACVIARAFVLRNLWQSVRGRKTIAVGKSRTSQSCSVLFFPPSESRPKCISLGFLLVRFHLETGRVSRESDRIIPILSPRNLYHRIFACLLFLFTTDNGQ